MQNLATIKEEYVHQLFSEIAYRYDGLNSLLSFNRDKVWRKFAMEKAQLKEGGTALDVCCGTGLCTLELAKYAGVRGKVVGVDFCRDMLDIAEKNIEKTDLGFNVQLLEGNAMSLPFADNTFDCVTIGFALRNVPDIKAVLSEMYRVVGHGGTVVSLDLAKPAMPVFKQLYYLYFERILPYLGKLGVGVDGPYKWLPQSLRLFPHQADLCAMLREVGLKNVKYYELTGGIVAVHVGNK